MARAMTMPWVVKRRITGVVAIALALWLIAPSAAQAATFSAPTYSSPITLSADGKLVWVVNPGGDKVADIV